MVRKMNLCMIAGAALSCSGLAMAQSTADLERAYAAELMADAAARTSELAQPGAFSVDVNGYMQFRYNWNNRGEAPEGEDDTTIGFQMARTRLIVSGNVVNEDWGYFVQFGVQPDGSFLLDDAYGTFRFETGWQFQFGQFKLPFSREALMGDQYLLAADRSVTNQIFSLDRSQGIQIGFRGEQIRFSGAFSDGATARNTDFPETPADYALTGRLDFKIAGAWSQARDFTSFPNSDYFSMVGVAGHWQSGGSTFGTFDHDMWALTADLSVEGNGWNVFGAGYWRSTDIDDGPSFDDLGLLVQGGIFVTPNTEIFARWDSVFPDGDWEPADSDFHSIALGVNHYFVPDSHAAKLTVDFQWFLDNPGDTGPVDFSTLVGLLPDSGDDQWNLRGQLQILF